MLTWWQKKVIYQIYPRSFQDSNGDGIGDIPGIISRLDYLQDLGVELLWLSPVYPSPNADYGYDISDYKGIQPEFGTMADMKQLIAEAKKRGIGIVMDLVINHTSDEHPWFQKSRDKNSSYRDYYIWRPGKAGGKKPPNNWSGFFGGGTWQFDEQSGEYYLHLFAKNQPDLNYHNPKVLDEIKDVMRFWLDHGVVGFRCDVINIIFKTSLADGKPSFILTGIEHYLSQDGNHKILQTLRRDVLDHYDCFTVGETVFVTPKMADDLVNPERKELNMIFSFEHMETDQWFVKWFKRKFRADRLAKTVSKWQKLLDWNANYFENHDQLRCVSRFGDDKEYWQQSAKMLCMMLFTLRGTPFVFQGQEIGMTNFDYQGMDELKDVESHNVYGIAKKLFLPAWYRWKLIKESSRDNSRTPMQWSAEAQAGFTKGSPWIGINKNYTKINVASQLSDESSVRNMYKLMIQLRKESAVLLEGDFTPVQIDKNFFAYKRTLNGESLLIALNFSKKEKKLNHHGQLVVSSYGRSDYNQLLQPYEGVILKIQ